jgi:hypothetical protein
VIRYKRKVINFRHFGILPEIKKLQNFFLLFYLPDENVHKNGKKCLGKIYSGVSLLQPLRSGLKNLVHQRRSKEIKRGGKGEEWCFTSWIKNGGTEFYPSDGMKSVRRSPEKQA